MTKISDLTEKTVPNANDYVPIVDSEEAPDETKRMTWGNLVPQATAAQIAAATANKFLVGDQFAEFLKTQSFDNLVFNGDFLYWDGGTNTPPIGWSLVGTPTAIVLDGGACKITSAGSGNEGASITLSNLKASTVYTVYAYLKATSGDIAKIWTTGASSNLSKTSTSTSGEYVTGTFTTDSTPTNVVLKIGSDTNTDIVWFDKILCVEGSLPVVFSESTSDSLLKNAYIFPAALGTDHSYSSKSIAPAQAGEALVFGDYCYRKSDGKLWKADADAAGAMPGAALALASISADAYGLFMVGEGFVRDDSWSWTVGGLIFASVTAGGLTQTQPVGKVQIVGIAFTATTMLFTPSSVSNLGRQTIPVPAEAMWPRKTNGCAAIAQLEVTSTKPNIVSLDFDASTVEYAQFRIQEMPKSWDGGTVTALFHWSHPSTATNFGVVWGLQLVCVTDGETIDAAYGTAQEVTDTGGNTNYKYKTAETSAITVAGSPAGGKTLYGQVYRLATSGSDTLAVDARLEGITIFFNTNAENDY